MSNTLNYSGELPLLMVVCTGNICRSPMGEAILRHQIQARDLAAQVDSCGLEAPIGRSPHRYALQVNEERGIPIDANKRSQQCVSAALRHSTLILVMEQHHRHQILHRFPAVGGKTFLLGHWQEVEIADPVRAPRADFEQVFDELEVGCAAWLDHLLKAGLISRR